jgi:hypothetical protein
MSIIIHPLLQLDRSMNIWYGLCKIIVVNTHPQCSNGEAPILHWFCYGDSKFAEPNQHGCIHSPMNFSFTRPQDNGPEVITI